MTAPLYPPTSSSTTTTLYSDNKYAKRRSQMEDLWRNQYRNHTTSQRFVLMLIVMMILSFVSFWIISGSMSARYAGSKEDVRSLQDLADSIRRVRLRRQQALGSSTGYARSRGNSINSFSGDTNDYQVSHGGGGNVYRGRPGGRQHQPMMPGGLVGDYLDDDGSGDEKHRPTAFLHHSRYRDGQQVHGPHYKPSDHGGDRFRERLDIDERRWKSDEEGQIDEELRLELLESKIRASHETRVHEEIRAKRLEDKMDATIEALKKMQHPEESALKQGRKVSSDSSVGGAPAGGGDAAGTPVDPLGVTADIIEQESFT